LSLNEGSGPAKLRFINRCNASLTSGTLFAVLGPAATKRPIQVKKMDPKLYLLFALFSIVIASAFSENLREYARKSRFTRLHKNDITSQA
jgi:hypothetical protein